MANKHAEKWVYIFRAITKAATGARLSRSERARLVYLKWAKCHDRHIVLTKDGMAALSIMHFGDEARRRADRTYQSADDYSDGGAVFASRIRAAAAPLPFFQPTGHA